MLQTRRLGCSRTRHTDRSRERQGKSDEEAKEGSWSRPGGGPSEEDAGWRQAAGGRHPGAGARLSGNGEALGAHGQGKGVAWSCSRRARRPRNGALVNRLDGKASMRGAPVEERFWSYVDKTDGCWLWTGAKYRDGYGAFKATASRLVRAHRYMYELAIGHIPDGLLVCHTCDIRHCVNPEHFFLGTTTDNVADCIAKGRNIFGTRHPFAKLSEHDVVLIRDRGFVKEPMRIVAAELGITSLNTISKARRGITWANVDGPVIPNVPHRGEGHSLSRLRNTDVLKIRSRLTNGDRGRDIAKDFQVPESTVSKIKHRTAWKHI